MLRFRSSLWVLMVLAVAVGAAQGADAVAASGPHLTAITGLPRTVSPGAGLALKYSAIGTSRRPVSATLTATMQAAGGRPVRLARPTVVKVRRGRVTRGRLALAVPHGLPAKAYSVTVCLRAGRAAARCRRAGSFVLGRECSCVQPGARPASPAPAPTPGAAAAAGSSAVPAGGGGDPALTFDAGAEPDPISVDPALDTAHAVTQAVDTIGGTLEATGADGTHYKLEIPYLALAARTQITMTPLKAVGRLPFSGGLVAGVQLAPDGLRFARFVRLTITGAPHVDPDRETPFSYRGDGQQLALAPMVRDTSLQAFDLLHFSAYGIAAGSDAERRAQLVHRTTDVEGQLQQIVAFELASDRTYTFLGKGRPMDYTVLEDAMRHYHDQVIAPLLQAAAEDVELAPRALTKYLAWERQMQWMFPDRMKDERAARRVDFLKVLDKVAHHYYAKCLAGDPGALPVLLAWSRQVQLMPDAGDWQEVQRVFDACAQFDVDVETTIDQSGQGQNQTFHGHLRLPHVKLTLQGGFQVMGSGPWTEDAFTVLPAGAPDVGCWLATNGFKPTDTHLVGPLELGVNWIENADGDEYHLQEADIADVGLAFAPLQTSEEVHWGFCGGSTGQGGTRNWLGVTLDALHADERPAGALSWVVENWTRPSNDAFVLTKRYQRTKTVDHLPTTEDTTLVLRHTPAAVG